MNGNTLIGGGSQSASIRGRLEGDRNRRFQRRRPSRAIPFQNTSSGQVSIWEMKWEQAHRRRACQPQCPGLPEGDRNGRFQRRRPSRSILFRHIEQRPSLRSGKWTGTNSSAEAVRPNPGPRSERHAVKPMAVPTSCFRTRCGQILDLCDMAGTPPGRRRRDPGPSPVAELARHRDWPSPPVRLQRRSTERRFRTRAGAAQPPRPSIGPPAEDVAWVTPQPRSEAVQRDGRGTSCRGRITRSPTQTDAGWLFVPMSRHPVPPASRPTPPTLARSPPSSSRGQAIQTLGLCLSSRLP